MADEYRKIIIDAQFLIALLENSMSKVNKGKIINCIENGADVNARFPNYANNTPLHIAVIQGDRELVNTLLNHNARADIVNDDGKTALEVAKELPERSDISEILAAWQKPYEKKDTAFVVDHTLVPSAVCTYKKRPGTANVRGQLYETKLPTLIYLRAARCRHITQFYMGSNVDEIGDIDDVCLRFKTLNDDCMIFLQAKHKDNIVKGKIGIEDLWRISGDFSLRKYFDSYRQIRDKFSPNSEDKVFRGRFEDIKCYFVIYTTVKDDLDCDLKQLAPYDAVTHLIGTGEQENIFKLKYNEQFIDLLTKTSMVEHMKIMGLKFLKLILSKKHDMMLGDENIRSFHVVLAQKVIEVSELDAERLRTGKFREDFFSSSEELLIALREVLCQEAAKYNKFNSGEIDNGIHEILKKPDADTISTLIGSILTYDSSTNILRLNDKKSITYNSLLSRLHIPQSVINEAYAIAGRKKLLSLTFKLPAAFGNLDMTITVNKTKGEKRLELLANKITDVIKESADDEGNVVLREGVYATDKQLEAGMLAINGGIAGAVGNLLIPDDKNKLKFNLDCDALGANARSMLLKLENRLADLHKYRFIPETADFPRVSLCATEDEKKFVTDFLDNLYFYTCQAKVDQLEGIATNELHTYERSNNFSKTESLLRSNTLFLKVHNEIQIWWMTEQLVPYLTRNTFDNIFLEFKNKGLLMFLNYIYLNEMHHTGIEFVPDAIEMLSICGCDAKMIVVHTDVQVLTCHKLVQIFRDTEGYIFLDVDYLSRISPHCLKIISNELTETNIRNVVIVCDNMSKYNDLIYACSAKKVILVTSDSYFKTEDCIYVKDYRINLTDLTDASQRKVLQTKFKYQCTEVMFADIFHEDMKYLINSKVLEKIISKDYITLGQMPSHSLYEEIKHYYIPRTLQFNTDSCNTRNNSNADDIYIVDESSNYESKNKFTPTTLIDHHNIFEGGREETQDVILILDLPGMGKSTLLTHLSLETKRRYPRLWIQRINLIDHTKQFHDWHENKVEVDSEEALKFICKTVLSKICYENNVCIYNTKIIHNLEVVGGEIKLSNNGEENALITFELNTFLYCFKKGQSIFVIDGFDEICPHYKDEVTKLLKYLARCSTVQDMPGEQGFEQKLTAQCVWITSRPYNDSGATLKKEFGQSYTLEPFSFHDIHIFLDKYMRRNIDINNLTNQQLQNIDGFFQYMLQCPMSSTTTHDRLIKNVYVAAVQYFENEIKRFIVTDDSLKYVKKWDKMLTRNNTLRVLWHRFLAETKEVPLHVYFAIHYFVSRVKDTSTTENLIKQWDLYISTIAFYERFVETKLKTIRFAEKNRMNIYHPDVKLTYEKEKKEFLDKHKKLGFYVMCHKEMLTDDELKEVQDIISSIEKGEEKNGFIDRIVNSAPRFIHYTFAEYFAMEFIADKLKSKEPSEKQKMLDYIMQTKEGDSLLSTCILDLLNIKIELDPEFGISQLDALEQYFIFEDLERRCFRNDSYEKPFEIIATLSGLRHVIRLMILNKRIP